MDAALAGRDALGVMPTGGGKSLCYQIPALMSGGVTLVISPLISLMKDQVTALESAGIAAAFINSSMEPRQIREAYAGARAGKYKLIYIAPERLATEDFAALSRELDIALVAVDEAHCISQWGQDFRPSYLKIADFLERLPHRPVLMAFTATATERVRRDIIESLGLRDPLCIITGFDRPNLYFEVSRPKNRQSTLETLVAERSGRSGIIYCATRRAVERVCDALRARGVAVVRYHAGLEDEERRQNQEDFLHDRKTVMVATNAFGMGIDKSNVSFVIHYNIPKSLEAYYQEAGRAGRDGEPADCILLYSAADIVTAKFLIQSSGENGGSELDYRRLDAMIDYCKTTSCLRGRILGYFGQTQEKDCGSCGNCRTAFVLRDITTQAQMILSCVKRIRDKLGYSVGAALVVRVLHGSADKRLLQLGLDELSTYDLMRDTPRNRIREYIEHLEDEGYLLTDPSHSALSLTEAAAQVLFHGVQVNIASAAEPELRKTKRKKTPPDQAAQDSDLLSALKALRFRLAQERGVPPYIIFSNANLADMAERAPRTISEFLEVSGVGSVKAAQYGKIFLDEIAAFKEEAN